MNSRFVHEFNISLIVWLTDVMQLQLGYLHLISNIRDSWVLRLSGFICFVSLKNDKSCALHLLSFHLLLVVVVIRLIYPFLKLVSMSNSGA